MAIKLVRADCTDTLEQIALCSNCSYRDWPVNVYFDYHFRHVVVAAILIVLHLMKKRRHQLENTTLKQLWIILGCAGSSNSSGYYSCLDYSVCFPVPGLLLAMDPQQFVVQSRRDMVKAVDLWIVRAFLCLQSTCESRAPWYQGLEYRHKQALINVTQITNNRIDCWRVGTSSSSRASCLKQASKSWVSTRSLVISVELALSNTELSNWTSYILSVVDK